MVWKGWGTPGPHSSPAFSTSHTLKTFQRIPESLRLEKTFETKSKHQHHHCAHPNSCPQVPHPQCLWAPPGMVTPMLLNLFHAEVFPPKPPLGQLEAIFSSCALPLGEETPGCPLLSGSSFSVTSSSLPTGALPNFLPVSQYFAARLQAQQAGKAGQAWVLSVNWHPLCKIKTINIYISFKGFSQSQGSSLDSNNFPSWDTKFKKKKKNQNQEIPHQVSLNKPRVQITWVKNSTQTKLPCENDTEIATFHSG